MSNEELLSDILLLQNQNNALMAVIAATFFGSIIINFIIASSLNDSIQEVLKKLK